MSLDLPRLGDSAPKAAAEAVIGYWTAEEAALDDLWQATHEPSDFEVDDAEVDDAEVDDAEVDDAEVDALSQAVWTLNLGGEGERLPAVEGRIVNVNSMTLEGSLRDPAWVARSARKDGHLFVIADARELPFRGGSVDAVVSFDLVEEDRASVVAEAGRVLRPGGRQDLEFCDHGIDSKWHNDTERRRAWLDGTPDPGAAWSRKPQEVTLGPKPGTAEPDGPGETPVSR